MLHRKNRVDQMILAMRSEFPATILCNLKPSPFVWVFCTNNVKPQAYLISLQHRQAKTDINGASNHEMDCFTEYYNILDG